ncbi:glucosaminidase domain-containing protein [Spirochaeta cellobiosiphila]|uniref:glucosaminidase domain-containing protein n=1 Tax=Spirochaeta cellobiosiphila TaxID=504483 RepID=UPI0003F5B6C2|nr:glucosaminidase domain-containing protein [Spirochaeta cellobiosiphila]
MILSYIQVFVLIFLLSPLYSFSMSPMLVGTGQSRVEDLALFLLHYNPDVDKEYAYKLAYYYVDEARQEGINHDIAFFQMLLETGFLRFGGQVKASQNNFCGLGALDGGEAGASFPSVQMGVRAHIQHLKAYASTEDLINPLIDPRFQYVVRGEVHNVYDLSGRWASDPDYGKKIASLAQRFLQFYNQKS